MSAGWPQCPVHDPKTGRRCDYVVHGDRQHVDKSAGFPRHWRWPDERMPNVALNTGDPLRDSPEALRKGNK